MNGAHTCKCFVGQTVDDTPLQLVQWLSCSSLYCQCCFTLIETSQDWTVYCVLSGNALIRTEIVFFKFVQEMYTRHLKWDKNAWKPLHKHYQKSLKWQDMWGKGRQNLSCWLYILVFHSKIHDPIRSLWSKHTVLLETQHWQIVVLEFEIFKIPRINYHVLFPS